MAVLDQCLLVKGISGVPIAPFNGAPHALELSTWLTATLPDSQKRDVVNIAISADQIAANYVGAFTPLPSLELATMPQTHMEHQEGLNEAYYSHCSFRGPDAADAGGDQSRAAFSSGCSNAARQATVPASKTSCRRHWTARCSTWSWAVQRTCAEN